MPCSVYCRVGGCAERGSDRDLPRRRIVACARRPRSLLPRIRVRLVRPIHVAVTMVGACVRRIRRADSGGAAKKTTPERRRPFRGLRSPTPAAAGELIVRADTRDSNPPQSAAARRRGRRPTPPGTWSALSGATTRPQDVPNAGIAEAPARSQRSQCSRLRCDRAFVHRTAESAIFRGAAVRGDLTPPGSNGHDPRLPLPRRAFPRRLAASPRRRVPPHDGLLRSGGR